MKLINLLLILTCLGLVACEGDDGDDGVNGVDGMNGMNGADGADGDDGGVITNNAPIDAQLFGRSGAVDEQSAVGNLGVSEADALFDRELLDAERRLSLRRSPAPIVLGD